MMLVKLGNEEQKRKVLGRKMKLKGKKEKIMDDWTWKEKRMRWRLEGIARSEERKGRRAWVGYERIRMREQWWK